MLWFAVFLLLCLFLSLHLSLCMVSLSSPSFAFSSFHLLCVLGTSSILPAFTLGISPYILRLQPVKGLNCGDGTSLYSGPPSYSDAFQGLYKCPQES